jgi:hypothetical protein
MWFCLRVWAATALWMVMFSTATAHADVPRTADGNGVLAGVYDVKANRVVDIQDPGWLDALSS